MTIDTLKQAAQALREYSGNLLEQAISAGPNKRGFYLAELAEKYSKLAAALEAMAEQQALTLPIEIHDRLYEVPIAVQVHIVNLRMQLEAAPTATPEHDAKVRDAVNDALERAAVLCERARWPVSAAHPHLLASGQVCATCIRSLKSTGGAA